MLSCVVSRAPLLPIGSLTTCTTMSAPSRSSSVIGGTQGRCRRRRRCVAIDGARRRRAQDVVGVQERGAIQADLDEGGLHARHDPLHAALVDVADDAAAPAAFDVQFLQHPVLDDGHAGLARRHVDQDLFAHLQRPECAQQLRRLEQRQSHHAGIASRQARDEAPARCPGSHRRPPCPPARRWRRRRRSPRRPVRRRSPRIPTAPASRVRRETTDDRRRARDACVPTAGATWRRHRSRRAACRTPRSSSTTSVSAPRPVRPGPASPAAARHRPSRARRGARSPPALP